MANAIQPLTQSTPSEQSFAKGIWFYSTKLGGVNVQTIFV